MAGSRDAVGRAASRINGVQDHATALTAHAAASEATKFRNRVAMWRGTHHRDASSGETGGIRRVVMRVAQHRTSAGQTCCLRRTTAVAKAPKESGRTIGGD